MHIFLKMSTEDLSLKSNTTFFFPNFPFEHLPDARTQHWLLVDSFWNVAALVILYLLMVCYLPSWTKGWKPFRLKYILILYNMFMTFLNVHICKELVLTSWKLNYNFWCQPCRVIYSKDELRIASAVWLFYLSKLIEFSDTLFFILRKKSEQLTFLHVYHHSTMFGLWWMGTKWFPTGSTYFPTMINSFVHVIMYAYYALAAVGPSMQKYLWWKKYLTILQLVQFSIGVVWSTRMVVTGCDFPIWMSFLSLLYMILFLILFGRFYVAAYQRKVK